MQTFWRNVPSPEVTDWVGVFLLHNSSEPVDPVTHAPTKFQVNHYNSPKCRGMNEGMKGPKPTQTTRRCRDGSACADKTGHKRTTQIFLHDILL